MKPVAVVLAGGVGKRFEPFITSKPLWTFFGKPLIWHNLKALSDSGFSEAVVVTSQKDKSEIDALQIEGFKINSVVQDKPLGMADALISSQKMLNGKSIVVMNAADLVGEVVFTKLVDKAKEKLVMVGKKVKEYFPGGYFKVEGGRVVAVVEKPGEGNEPSDLVKLVFDYFPKASELIEEIKKTSSKEDDVYEVSLSQMIGDKQVSVISYDGYWQPLKYSWHVLEMSMLLLNEKLNPGNEATFVAESALVEENVYLGKGVKVLEGAVIRGPSYIGDNTIVGNNSLVRESIIENDCVIGFGSEVARSYFGKRCWLHTNYVGDSVLEENVALGAGVVTANFRLDERNVSVSVKEDKIDSGSDKLGTLIAKDVRVGINTSVMPGVKIGTNTFIGPGITLASDIGSNVKVFSKEALVKEPLNIKIGKR
jgi:bifunctional UDP-N-acetylglucosamine pyrophosphorylase/glucosamine-1-phosphate N-acetyltransferase